MKPSSADMVFLLPLDAVPKIARTSDRRYWSEPILNLITSEFPAESFAHQRAKQGKPPGLACNNFRTEGDKNIFVNLLASRQGTGTEPVRCLIISWLLPRSPFRRGSYKTRSEDFQLIEDLHKKIGLVLEERFGAKECEYFHSGDGALLAKYPEFR